MREKVSGRLQGKPFSSENEKEMVSQPAKGESSSQWQQGEGDCLHKMSQGREDN